jgi:CspA family cold shock protein
VFRGAEFFVRSCTFAPGSAGVTSGTTPAQAAPIATAAVIYPLPSFPMLTGTVKFYNDSKGFGFIIPDDTEEEIFVHQTGLIHEIQEGDRVQFNIKAGKKGPNAVDVTRIQ